MAALDQYEAACCRDCGTPHAEGLFDSERPIDQRVQWLSGMVQCEPCKAVEVAQHKHMESLRKRHGDNWFASAFMKWFPIRKP